MKLAIISALALFSVVAQAESDSYITGDKIHFQKASTWVSALYSKTLCLAGDTFYAVSNQCVEWGGGDNDYCRKFKKVTISQPVNSTREVCVESSGGESDFCRKWKTVPYVQNPVRKVEFIEGSRVVDTKIVTVKACR